MRGRSCLTTTKMGPGGGADVVLEVMVVWEVVLGDLVRNSIAATIIAAAGVG